MNPKLFSLIVMFILFVVLAKTNPISHSDFSDWKKYLHNSELYDNLCLGNNKQCETSSDKNNETSFLHNYNTIKLGYQTLQLNNWISDEVKNSTRVFLSHVNNFQKHFSDLPSFQSSASNQNRDEISSTHDLKLAGLNGCDWMSVFCDRLAGKKN